MLPRQAEAMLEFLERLVPRLRNRTYVQVTGSVGRSGRSPNLCQDLTGSQMQRRVAADDAVSPQLHQEVHSFSFDLFERSVPANALLIGVDHAATLTKLSGASRGCDKRVVLIDSPEFFRRRDFPLEKRGLWLVPARLGGCAIHYTFCQRIKHETTRNTISGWGRNLG